MTARADTDAFVRFAKAHLPSKAERTIYPVLAGAPDRDWTAGEVAATAGVSHHEADQALRRFASAGIVDHSHVRGQSHRYRWHPDMGYLRQGDVSGPAIDPVCGMPVPPPGRRTPPATTTRRSGSALSRAWSDGGRTGVGHRADLAPDPVAADLHDPEPGRGDVVLGSAVDLRSEQPPRQR